jgi:hypothetical protein
MTQESRDLEREREKSAVASFLEKHKLTLVARGNPRGEVENHDGKNPWPHIAYDVALMSGAREIWRGTYRLGIGHVDPGKPVNRFLHGLTPNEEYLLGTWSRKPHANFLDKELHAQTAAKLAKIQKVSPQLADVFNSLLSDGAAHFDSQTFECWCAELGYDSDSRRAHKSFTECDAIGRALALGLGREVIDEAREVFSNY